MSQRDLKESLSSSSSSQPSQQLQPRASFSALPGSASSRSLIRAPRQRIPRHLVFRTEPLYQLNQAFNQEFNSYQGEVTTAYGVKHPKEFIRYFQKKVLWGVGDINLVLANFLQNSDMYQKLNEGKVDSQANPLYKLHLNKKLEALAFDPKIEDFGQIKYLLDEQFPKMKAAIKAKRAVFEKMKNDFIIIETVLEHSAGNIELYDSNTLKKHEIEHRHIINLQVLLQDALVHIKFCAKKRKINFADQKSDDSLNNIELKHIKSFVATELPIELSKAYNMNLSEGFDLLVLYKRVEKYIAFLKSDVDKIISGSEDLQALHACRLNLLEALDSLNINTFALVHQGSSSIMKDYSRAYIERNLRKCGILLIENLNSDSRLVDAAIKQILDLTSSQDLKAVSVSAVPMGALSADSVGPSLVTIYRQWFASIYSACLNSAADYARLMDLVKTDEESGKELLQGSSKKGTSTLFTAKSRVQSALLLSPKIEKDKVVIQEAKNILVPCKLDNRNIDILHYLLSGATQIPVFTDCLTVQEQLRYVMGLAKLLSDKSVEISGHIAFQRASLIASTVKSDAFILRVPSEAKSLLGLTCLVNPHDYARSLVAELKSDKRAGLWTAILDFADLYLQLVSKIHFIQLDIGRRSDLNKSSDEAIGALLSDSDSSFKDDIYLFLELVGKIQTAAIQLKKLLAPLEEGDEARISDIYWQTASKVIRAFISGVKDFNVMFEASCNRPTAAMFGQLKSPEELKKLYRNLYLRFNHFLDANSRIAPWNENFELKPAPKSLLVMPELSQSISIAPASSVSAAPRLDRESSVLSLDESKRESKNDSDPFDSASAEEDKAAQAPSVPVAPELSNQQEIKSRLRKKVINRFDQLAQIANASSASSSLVSSVSLGSSSSESSGDSGVPVAPPMEEASSSSSMQSAHSNSSSSSSSVSSVSLGSSSSESSGDSGVPVAPPMEEASSSSSMQSAHSNSSSSSSSVSSVSLGSSSSESSGDSDVPVAPPIEEASSSSPAQSASSSSSSSSSSASSSSSSAASSSSEEPREQKDERSALLASIQGSGGISFLRAKKAANSKSKPDDAKDKPVEKSNSPGGLAGALQRSLTMYRSRIADVESDDEATPSKDEWDEESSAGPKNK